MGLPNVKITLGSGKLGRVSSTSDGVAGLCLTGVGVENKLELQKAYQISGISELSTLGITAENNPLCYKEIKAFFAQAGEGSELWFLLCSQATTLEDMCSLEENSPIRNLIDSAGGRIKLVGLNKLPQEGYEPDLLQGIDGDAIKAAEKSQNIAMQYADKIQPFRVIMPAPFYKEDAQTLFKPREASYNRVCFVIASDDSENKTSAVAQVLGRAAKISVSSSIARVKDGAMASEGYLTNGKTSLQMQGKAEILHDAGYIIYRHYPTKNGVYLNDDPMAAPVSDDYSQLNLGRVIDKAIVIAFQTYIGEIMDNITIGSDGKLPQGVTLSFQSMIENAVATALQNEISSFAAYIDPNQNLISSGELKISFDIVPLATLRKISVNLGFKNPSIN